MKFTQHTDRELSAIQVYRRVQYIYWNEGLSAAAQQQDLFAIVDPNFYRRAL